MKLLSIVFIMVLLYACGAKLAVLGQADADRGASKFPGTTVASLNAGKMHYEQNCQSCHPLKNPTSQTEAKWREIVPDMVGKVNKRAGKIALDSAVQESILRYVVTMGSAPKPGK